MVIKQNSFSPENVDNTVLILSSKLNSWSNMFFALKILALICAKLSKKSWRCPKFSEMSKFSTKGGVRLAVKVMLGLKGECLDKHVIYCFCFLTINDVETNEHHIFHKWWLDYLLLMNTVAILLKWICNCLFD